MLEKYVRYQVQNLTGVAFGGLAGDTILLTGSHQQFTVGTGVFVSPPTAEVPFNVAAATLGNGLFLTSPVIDTTSDGTTSGTRLTTQSDFNFSVGITNVPNGTIVVWMQQSADNVTWPADGVGQWLCTMTLTASGAQKVLECHGR